MMNTKTTTIFVDRIEGDFAVLDWDGEEVSLPVVLFPGLVAEGDAFTITLEPAPEEAERLREDIRNRLEDLASKDDGGDFDL